MKNKKQQLADVRKALSSKQLSTQQSVAIQGGSFPWIDQPGG